MSNANKHWRGLDIFNPNLYKNKKIGIIGAGGIGSNAAFVLAKMGLKIKVIDFDIVEEHNMGSQFYSKFDIGRSKVEALKDKILLNTDEEIEIVNEAYKKEHTVDCDVLVLALDSLDIRKMVIDEADGQQFILDTRMLGTVSQVYCFLGMMKRIWNDEEYDPEVDKRAGNVACTAKAIAFQANIMGGMVGALAAKQLKWDTLEWKYMFDSTTMTLLKAW